MVFTFLFSNQTASSCVINAVSRHYMQRCRSHLDLNELFSCDHQPTGRTNDFISVFDTAQQPRLVSLGHICLTDMHSCRNQRDNRTAQQMTTYVRDCPHSCTSHRGPSTKATIPFHKVFVRPVAESNSRPISTKRMHYQLVARNKMRAKKTRETKRNK